MINTIVSRYKKNNNPLSDLMKQYGSDKGSPVNGDKSLSGWDTHLYTDFYHILFHNNRDSIVKVFECGLGTNDPTVKSSMGLNGLPGASLRAWRDYFPNAMVYGADIDKSCLFEEDRIKTLYVDQTDKDSIIDMWNSINEDDGSFDLILDDGLHTAEAAITLLENSFYKLKDNGIYIIEDVMYFWQEVKVYLEGHGYDFMLLDFSDDSSYCFVIFK
jgi:hypothetical protein